MFEPTLPHADYEGWLQVLDTLASWNAAIIIPGHGEPATTKNLKWQRDYLADMLQQVRAGISKGLSREALIESVDLNHHPVYGDNKVSSARSVRAMVDKLLN